MGSFHELPEANRLLPGDLVLIPPETSGTARRMRLAPQSLRRKYGFRVGANFAPYYGSSETALRNVFYDRPDSPKWLLVSDVRVCGPADSSDALLSVNCADASSSEPYPLVDHVYAVPIPDDANLSALAATALLDAVIDRGALYQGNPARYLPRFPLEAAVERALASYAPELGTVGQSEDLHSAFYARVHFLGTTGERIPTRTSSPHGSARSFTPSSIPSASSGVRDIVQYACYSMRRLPTDYKVCIPKRFFDENCGIRAFRMTDAAADEAAASVMSAAFAKARSELRGTAAYAHAVAGYFETLSGDVSGLCARMPDPPSTGAGHAPVAAELADIQSASEPPKPVFDVPYTAVARIRAVAGEAAA